VSQIFRDLQRSEKDRTETNAQIINAHFVLIFEGRNPEIIVKLWVLKKLEFWSKIEGLIKSRNLGQKSEFCSKAKF